MVGRETDNEQGSTWELHSVALITMQLTHGYSQGEEIFVQFLVYISNRPVYRAKP